jgi:hypothetical protein
VLTARAGNTGLRKLRLHCLRASAARDLLHWRLRMRVQVEWRSGARRSRRSCVRNFRVRAGVCSAGARFATGFLARRRHAIATNAARLGAPGAAPAGAAQPLGKRRTTRAGPQARLASF